MKFKEIMSEKNDRDFIISSFKTSIKNTNNIIDIKVSNVKDAIDSMKKYGFDANIKKGQARTITVSLKDNSDKTKLKNWMLNNGWDISDIRELYPIINI